jgi:hypothetical protein
MITKAPLDHDRVRKITGSFAFIEHRFLRNGFFSALTHHELLLYVLLVLVGDGLIEKDLIAFNGHLFQVLCLPETPWTTQPGLLKTSEQMMGNDPATVSRIIENAFGSNNHGK